MEYVPSQLRILLNSELSINPFLPNAPEEILFSYMELNEGMTKDYREKVPIIAPKGDGRILNWVFQKRVDARYEVSGLFRCRGMIVAGLVDRRNRIY